MAKPGAFFEIGVPFKIGYIFGGLTKSYNRVLKIIHKLTRSYKYAYTIGTWMDFGSPYSFQSTTRLRAFFRVAVLFAITTGSVLFMLLHL